MQVLQQSMQEHLRLHFNNEEASDEQVLAPPKPNLKPVCLTGLRLAGICSGARQASKQGVPTVVCCR